MLINRRDIQITMWNYLACISHLRNWPVANFLEWRMSDAINIPIQSINNIWDCGVFLCPYVEHLGTAKGMDFNQFSMNDYRKKIVRSRGVN